MICLLTSPVDQPLLTWLLPSIMWTEAWREERRCLNIPGLNQDNYLSPPPGCPQISRAVVNFSSPPPLLDIYYCLWDRLLSLVARPLCALTCQSVPARHAGRQRSPGQPASQLVTQIRNTQQQQNSMSGCQETNKKQNRLLLLGRCYFQNRRTINLTSYSLYNLHLQSTYSGDAVPWMTSQLNLTYPFFQREESPVTWDLTQHSLHTSQLTRYVQYYYRERVSGNLI